MSKQSAAQTQAKAVLLPKKVDFQKDSRTAMKAGISNEEFRERILQVPVCIVKPMIRNQLRPGLRSPALQVIRQRTTLPRPPLYQLGLTQELAVPECESAKMLVILDNGEQRLITFTLPKEPCTVQELLDQVGIQVGADSNIECIENPGSEIDYIVRIGNFPNRDFVSMTKAAENHIRQQAQRKMIQNQSLQVMQPPAIIESVQCSSSIFDKQILQAQDVRTMNVENQLRPVLKSSALQDMREQTALPRPGPTHELEVPKRKFIRMLVIWDNGEQRLITFSLPKETYTMREFLDQIGIQVAAESSNIECFENPPGAEIDYIVRIGNFPNRDFVSMTKAAENHIRQQAQRKMIQNQSSQVTQPPAIFESVQCSSSILHKQILQAQDVRPMNVENQLRLVLKSSALQDMREQTELPRPEPTQGLEVPKRKFTTMLVIRDNGEQQLVTFNLSKETCTVRELLEQVDIQVATGTNIECTVNPGSKIEYIVKVGNFPNREGASTTKI